MPHPPAMPQPVPSPLTIDSSSALMPLMYMESPTWALVPPPREMTVSSEVVTKETSRLSLPEDGIARMPSRHVGFVNSPTHGVHRSVRLIQPYSEVYGAHPSEFDFDEFGNKMPRAFPIPVSGPCVQPVQQPQELCATSGIADRYDGGYDHRVGSATRLGVYSNGNAASYACSRRRNGGGGGYDVNLGGDGIF